MPITDSSLLNLAGGVVAAVLGFLGVVWAARATGRTARRAETSSPYGELAKRVVTLERTNVAFIRWYFELSPAFERHLDDLADQHPDFHPDPGLIDLVRKPTWVESQPPQQ